MAKKLSQNEKVKKHLLKHKSITSMQAIVKYKILRLASRIHDLTSDGMTINRKRVDNKKTDTHWTKYYI